jgi:hypothetical protein
MSEVARPPHCPRCGYDLRGTIGAWRATCPMQGTCNECGLEFAWGDLFAAERGRPLWCVEYSLPGRVFRGCAGTLFRSFWPWAFWRQLRMEHAIRWRRITAYIAIVFLLPVFLIYLTAQTMVAVYVRYQTEVSMAEQRNHLAQSLARLQATVPDDPESAARITVQTERLQLMLSVEVVIEQSYLNAVREAVLHPWRGFSTGRITQMWGVQPYTAPAELYTVAGMLASQRLPARPGPSRWWNDREAIDPILMMLLAGVAVLALVPLSMALLPISRRRAHVQWRHIARIWSYSAVLPIGLTLAVGVLYGIALAAPTWSVWTWSAGLWLAQFGLPVASFLWWWAAITRYLRMPRGAFIALMLTILSMLLVAVAVSLFAWDVLYRARH